MGFMAKKILVKYSPKANKVFTQKGKMQMSMRKLTWNVAILAAAICVAAAMPSFAANEPMSAVSGGVDIVSAGSDAPSATTVALETRYSTTDFSNFINMITEKIKGFILLVK